MNGKIIPFPTTNTNDDDPKMARALFFAEVEYQEIVATVPRAIPSAPKKIY